MRYGIVILPDMPWRTARPLWERAEQMGFTHAWTYDHLVWGGLPDSQWFSSIPTLTAVAAITSSIRLGTFVASPNFRHPAAFSREVQTLADISDDRLMVGLGVGGSPDSHILGQPDLSVRQRVDRFQEFVGVLGETLRNDHVSVDGEYFSTRDMRLVGGEVRSRVPLILAGNGPRSVRFAARHGDGWVTTGSPADTVDEWFAGVAANHERVREAAQGCPIDTYLAIDFAPTSPLSSVAAFDDLAGRAAAIGFSDLIVHWPRDAEPYLGDVAVLEELAARGLG